MEKQEIDQSPFREAADITRFFPGGKRREMLESLKSAIVESVSLIILTGDEGCGKTMMCRMVEKELPDGYILIFFSDMLESFEDVTRTIAREMKITLADGIAAGDIRELLFEVWERLSEKKQKMLLVFDQAERIYLATFERIRKMLDIVNQTGINFQILFSGGAGLLDNLKQLSMCNLQGAEERHFILEPLDSSATYAYLNFCMKGEGDEEIFSLEASEKIFMLADGNIRKTNELAEELLRSLTPDSSFMVLLDNVRDTTDKDHSATWDFSVLLEKYRAYKKWLIPSGACLMVLVLILVLRIGRSADVHEKRPAPEIAKLSAEFNTIQKKEEAIEHKVKTVHEEQPPVEEKAKPRAKTTEVPPVQSSLKVEGITIKKAAGSKSTGTPAVENAGPPKVSKSENAIAKPPALSERAQQELVEKIFNERTAAAAKWLVGEKNNQFTIQLMVLASEGAENNLKKMLAKKEYQDQAAKLFILRKATSTPSILVFYGEYATMVEARSASKALPEFLLKHNPYAISIRGAIKKAISG